MRIDDFIDSFGGPNAQCEEDSDNWCRVIGYKVAVVDSSKHYPRVSRPNLVQVEGSRACKEGLVFGIIWGCIFVFQNLFIISDLENFHFYLFHFDRISDLVCLEDLYQFIFTVFKWRDSFSRKFKAFARVDVVEFENTLVFQVPNGGVGTRVVLATLYDFSLLASALNFPVFCLDDDHFLIVGI